MTVAIPRTRSADPAALRRLRKALGAPLPADYLEFLAVHDGAEPESNALSLPDNVVGVRAFIPAADIPSTKSKMDGFPSSAVPIAEDDCGSYFYLDRARKGVFFWDHENEEPDVKVASSFTAFLKKLEPFDEAAVDLDPKDVISAWIDPAFLAELPAEKAAPRRKPKAFRKRRGEK